MLIQLARAYGVPPGLPSGPAAPEPHDPLRLDGRGRVRRRGRRLVRSPFPISERRRRRHQPRLGRRQRAHPGGVRRRHTSRAFGDIPADGRGTRRRANGTAARSTERAAPVDRSGLPLLALRAGTVPRAGHRRRHAHDRRRQAADPVGDTKDRLRADKLAQVGRAAQDALGTLDEGLEFTQGTSTYVYLGSRLIRGWAVELVLIACLLPFLATAIDLFARCRRRHIPLAPALRGVSQPARVLGLGRRPLRALQAARRVAARRRAPDPAHEPARA